MFLFGTSLEDEIQTATKKMKSQTAIETKTRDLIYKWIAKPGEVLKGRFRDPMQG